MAAPPLRILLIGSDAGIEARLRSTLAETPGAGFEIVRVGSIAAAFDHVDHAWADAALFELAPSEGRGVEGVAELRARAPQLPVVVLAPAETEELALAALRAGAQDFVVADSPSRPSFVRILRHAIERNRLREVVRSGQEQLRRVLERSADGVVVLDSRGTVRFANAAAGAMLGRSPGALLGQPFGSPIAGGDVAELHVPRESGGTATVEVRITHVDWEGEAARLLALRDFTARRRLESALRIERDRARLYLDLADVVMLALDREGRVTLLNRAGSQLLGWDEAELLGKDWFATCLPARARDEVEAWFRQAVAGAPAGAGSRENALLTRSGEERLVVWRNAVLTGDDGRVTGTLSSGVDVTAERRLEAERRQAQDRYRRLVESIGEVFFEGRFGGDTLRNPLVLVTPQIEAVTGHRSEEFLAEDDLWSRLIHPDDLPAVTEATERAFARGESVSREYRLRRKDGESYAWLSDTVAPVFDEGGALAGFRGAARDVTARRSLEDQLRQAQKMEAVGRLAGGIAHDFNNALGVILGYADMLLRRGGDLDASHRRKLQQIRAAADRAASLTRQILAFGRKLVLQPEVLEPGAVVEGLREMLGRLIGEDVSLVVHTAPGTGRVKADRGQLEQVLMNLAVNARDAMPEGGRLAIEVANATLDAAYAASRAEVQPGRYVMLAVTDNGEGMGPDVLPHAFEPFFTTKKQGKGTGLGLSTVFGIVKQSGGHIAVYSEPGHGTTFKVYLPRAAEEAAEEAPERAGAPPGRATILVVEDEEALRELTAELLREGGYEVLAVSNGEEALRLCREREGPVDLIVTDVVMPGMGGAELVRRLAALGKETPALFISGYPERGAVHNGALVEGAPFLHKPFTAEDLLEKVRRALGGAEP